MGKIKLQDVKKALDLGREVLPVVKPAIEKYGPEAVDRMIQKARQAGEAVETARDSASGKLQQRKDERASKKNREEARKRAVLCSLPPVTAEDFFKSFEANVSDSSDLRTGYMAIPGCYAIITLRSAREKDPSAYRDVYVGCSDAIGFAVYSQLRGFGNADVYADFKFKEPMKVLVYPCDESQIEERFAGLVRDLQSASSYNKWELMDAEQAEIQ